MNHIDKAIADGHFAMISTENDHLIRPLMYYCRGVNDNDERRIRQRMKVIPESLRREVSDKYENLYIRNKGGIGRKDANQYLDGVASEYRAETPKRVIKLKPKVKPVTSKKTSREYKSIDGLWSKELK